MKNDYTSKTKPVESSKDLLSEVRASEDVSKDTQEALDILSRIDEAEGRRQVRRAKMRADKTQSQDMLFEAVEQEEKDRAERNKNLADTLEEYDDDGLFDPSPFEDTSEDFFDLPEDQADSGDFELDYLNGLEPVESLPTSPTDGVEGMGSLVGPGADYLSRFGVDPVSTDAYSGRLRETLRDMLRKA